MNDAYVDVRTRSWIITAWMSAPGRPLLSVAERKWRGAQGARTVFAVALEVVRVVVARGSRREARGIFGERVREARGVESLADKGAVVGQVLLRLRELPLERGDPA